jgi:hypothetical protein
MELFAGRKMTTLMKFGLALLALLPIWGVTFVWFHWHPYGINGFEGTPLLSKSLPKWLRRALGERSRPCSPSV